MHWTLESVFSYGVDVPIGRETVYVSATAEVPMIGDDRQPRRGNRYYPTLITLDVTHDSMTLFPEDARKLAHTLLLAAKTVEEIDKQDVDVCGHWWPCDCLKALRAREKTLESQQ